MLICRIAIERRKAEGTLKKICSHLRQWTEQYLHSGRVGHCLGGKAEGENVLPDGIGPFSTNEEDTTRHHAPNIVFYRTSIRKLNTSGSVIHIVLTCMGAMYQRYTR